MTTPIIQNPELSEAYQRGFEDGRQAERDIAPTALQKCPIDCFGYERIGTCKHLHPEWDQKQVIC